MLYHILSRRSVLTRWLVAALPLAVGLAMAPLTHAAQQAYLKASNTGAGDRFSSAVAVSGDTMVVGAPYESSSAAGVNGNQADNTGTNSGAVYVLVRSGTNWVQQAYLKASNPGVDDNFGTWVSVSGDTVVVGAPYEDSGAAGVDGNQADNSSNGAGAAYVFVRNGTNWTQQAYLKASNPGNFGNFGISVAVSGDTVIVGAHNESSAATGVNGNQAGTGAGSSGAVYVFVRNGTTWSQQAYLKASNTGSGDRFGYGLAISGDTAAIGAYGEASGAAGVNANQADNSLSQAGAAYIFTRTGTNWSQQAYLKASNPGANDFFGLTLAMAGDTVVVTAQGEASNATGVNGNQADDSASFAGAAYVFVRTGTNWSQQAYLKASNNRSSIKFGISVGVSGEEVVVGAGSENSGATGVNGNQADTSVIGAGAAYVFGRTGTNWTQQAYLKSSNTETGDQFGRTAAISGDTVVVGAEFEDSNATGANGNQADNSASSAGAAYVFTIAIPPTVTSVTPATGGPAGGTSVTITGTSFTGAAAVTFGGNVAVPFTVNNDTTITATTPPGTLGTVSVVVATPGGSNPANTLFTYVQPDIAVAQAGPLTDGVSTQAFYTTTLGSGPTLTFTVSNPGTAPLTNLVVTKDGTGAADFVVGALSGTSIPVGAGTVTFTVAFAPATVGVKTAALHIASNVSGSKNPFDIALTGQKLSYTQDTDNDGLNDASEYDMAALGFNWQVGQTNLVNTYYAAANNAGLYSQAQYDTNRTAGQNDVLNSPNTYSLYTQAQLQALNVNNPLIAKGTNGLVTLTLGVQRATYTTNFSAFPLNSPGATTVIDGAGKLKFSFPATNGAEIFRVQAQ